MKNLLLFPLFCGLLLIGGCAADRIEGSGNIITDDRTDGAFTAVEVNNALTVTIRQGSNHRVIVRGDDNLIGRIRATTSDGVLTAGLGRGSFRNATISMEITTPSLQRLALTDAASGELIDFVSDQEMQIELNAASDLELSGAAPGLRLTLRDASQLNGFQFSTDRCEIDIRSASNARLSVKEQLEGRVRDASTFRYRGTPVVEVSTSGASHVIQDN